MSQLIIKKSLFDEYFNLLYKIQYDRFLMNKDYFHKTTDEELKTVEKDYAELEIIKNKLEDKIKSIFVNSIIKGDKIHLDKKYHKASISFTGDDFNDGWKLKTNWYKETNKIILYYHLLFGSNNLPNEELTHCFRFWFADGDGYYPDKSEEFADIVIDKYIGSNLIDPIGSYLKNQVISANLDDSTDVNIKEIFTYKSQGSNTDDYLKNKYLKYMDEFDYYFEYKLTSHIMDGEEYIDLIELFDIFFLFNYKYDWNNVKCDKRYISNAIRINSTDDYGVKEINLFDDDISNKVVFCDYSSFNLFETDIDKNIESINFIKMIKNTLDFMDEDLEGRGQGERMDLYLTFFGKLKTAMDIFFTNN